MEGKDYNCIINNGKFLRAKEEIFVRSGLRRS